MSRNWLAAVCLAALWVGCGGTGARAGESQPPASDWFEALGGPAFAGAEFDGGPAAGAWTFRPVAGIHPVAGGAFDQDFGAGPASAASTAYLGFRGAAKVDSRVGTIYSRLTLSFEHEFHANPHRIVTGPSAARRTGFYGDRSEVDVMTADAVFAMRMSQWAFGFVEYGAEVEPGGAADHQVILRLRFDF